MRTRAERQQVAAVSIRAASPLDAALLATLNRDVQRLHAELDPGFFKPHPDDKEVAAFFADRIALPENHLLIAGADDGPKGYVWFEVQERPETPLTLARRRIYVHHLSVQASARGQGVASALLNRVEEEALARGIADVALTTWAANASACSFFSARGFAPFNVAFGKRLPQGDGAADAAG